MTNVEYPAAIWQLLLFMQLKGKLVAQAIEHFAVMGNAFYFCLNKCTNNNNVIKINNILL
ncbi:hypothetical protein E2R55_25165 [Vibrio vulnificus]|nr:hypothetical protein E2R55_25165 [Vibrio vulnificus]